MNTTDHWDDLKAAGAVPPPSAEVLAHARARIEQPSRRRVAPVVAVAAVVAMVAGVVGVRLLGSPGTDAPQTAPGISSPTSATVPSGQVAASCVSLYSPAQLTKRAFAVDGTVVAVTEGQAGGLPLYLLTVRVNEWFRPGNGPHEATLRTYNPPGSSNHQVSVDFPEYAVGSRLLLTGEPQWGGSDPLKDAIAWGCGFSRAYNAADAATWRQILRR